MRIYSKVKLKSNYAKWHLDHPEIYFCGDTPDDNYDTHMIMHLLCCMGERCIGTITKMGADDRYWYCEFKIDELEMSYYVERSHVDVFPIENLLYNSTDTEKAK